MVMTSYATLTRQRYPLKGIVVCIHQCPGRECTNRNNMTEWKREGGAIVKHQKSKKKHKGCTDTCPGYKYLKERVKISEGMESKSESTQSGMLCDNVGVGPSTVITSRRLSRTPPPIFRLLFIQDPDWR